MIYNIQNRVIFFLSFLIVFLLYGNLSTQSLSNQELQPNNKYGNDFKEAWSFIRDNYAWLEEKTTDRNPNGRASGGFVQPYTVTHR